MMINEDKIPYNFSWRAGIGKEAPDTNIGQNLGFSPFNSGFKPGESYSNMKTKDNLQFCQTLIAELDTHLTDIVENYKGHEWAELKQQMRNYIISVRTKYANNISDAFLELLYNTCLQQYTTSWVMICGEYEISNIAATEYVYTSSFKFIVNPFVVYQLFSSEIKPIKEEIITD